MAVLGKRRWVRRALGASGAFVVLAAVFTALGWPVYVRPQVDELRPADAIVVLGGPFYDRYIYGLELAERGLAPELVLSNPGPDSDRWLTKRICPEQHDNFQVRCFVPDPPTTKGEAREIARLADEEGWHTIIVVTFTPHVSRARYIVSQCFDGELIMAASPADISLPYWAFSYVYQTMGYARAVLQSGC